MAKSTSNGDSKGDVKARRAPGRRRSDKAPQAQVAEAADRGDVTAGNPLRTHIVKSTGPSAQDVQRRAFELFLERGGAHGQDMEDWLEAERQLRGGRE